MSRYYTFTMLDGTEKLMTITEALREAGNENDHIRIRIKEIIANSKVKRRAKDGFTPGWQENINEYAGGRKEYDRLLKEKGLVEIGYDYVPKESTKVSNPCASLEFALHAKEVGVELSDREVEAISTGEYFEKSASAIV